MSKTEPAKNKFYNQFCYNCGLTHTVMVEAFAPDSAHALALKSLGRSVTYCRRKHSFLAQESDQVGAHSALNNAAREETEPMPSPDKEENPR